MKNQYKEPLISLNKDGEIIDNRLHHYTCKKYRPDTPFFYGFMPYLLMGLCLVVDLSFFYSLFQRVSYDDSTTLIMEVVGLGFAADLVPVYAGVVAKRIRQGISREKVILCLLIAVPVAALIVNIILRASTIELMSADGTVDAAAKALTLISMVVPIFTSVAGFAISYSCYSPLEIQLYRQELALETQRDICRRLQGILGDYAADPDFVQRLTEEDEGKYREALKLQRAKAISYADYVRQRIKEHLANPSSYSALSQDNCDNILQRLDAELALLDGVFQEKAIIKNVREKSDDAA